MSKRIIAEFDLINGHYDFTADYKDKYTIAVEGGFFANTNNAFAIFSKDTGEKIKLKDTLPYAFYQHGTRCVEVHTFYIITPGQYELRITNADSIEVRKSLLSFINPFKSPIAKSNIKVLLMFNWI